MKKIMVIALALIMMLSCIACANNAADNSAANGSDETPVLKVALSPDYAPMEFVDTAKEGQEQFVGFDVTLAKHIAEQLGMKLEIEPMSFDACQVAVQMGNVDLGISGFSWTAERAENYLISDYYIAGDNETKQTIIVAADKAGQYTKAEDFAGMKIGAQAASLQELLCNEALPEDTTVELFKDINVAVVALQTGKVDDHVVAHVLPYAEEDDRQHSGVLAGGPLGQVLHAEARKDLVDRAHRGAEDHVPDGRDRDQRGNIREERDRAEEVAALDLLVQQHGQTKAADQRQRHGADGVDQRIDERRLEGLITEQRDKVADAGELYRMNTIPVAEGKRDGEDHGHQRKDAEADEVRCDEAVGDQAVPRGFFHAALWVHLYSLCGFGHGSYLLGG